MLHWLKDSSVKVAGWKFVCRYQNRKNIGFDIQELGLSDAHNISEQLNQFIIKAPKVFKNDKTTSVAQLDLKPGACIIKRYNARDVTHHFSRAIRPSRAQRCWSMSYKFARAGLNVATPLMMYERRIGPLRLDAYFLNEKLSGEELLTAFPKMSDQQKQQVVVQVNDAFKKMREAKISHGDMKATNLMWVDGQLYFIDLDAARQHYFTGACSRSNAKDKKRFLKNWQDQPVLLALFSELK